MLRYVLRTMVVPHCKRGPLDCEDCRATNIEKVYILDIDPPERGKVQRPIVELLIDGSFRSYEFDVVKGFGTEAEAVNFARNAGLVCVRVQE